jgi:hypothetical protein
MNRQQYEARLREEVEFLVEKAAYYPTVLHAWFTGRYFDFKDPEEDESFLFGYMGDQALCEKPGARCGCLTMIRAHRNTNAPFVAVTPELTEAIQNDARIPIKSEELWDWLNAAETPEKKREILEPLVEYQLKLHDHYAKKESDGNQDISATPGQHDPDGIGREG